MAQALACDAPGKELPPVYGFGWLRAASACLAKSRVYPEEQRDEWAQDDFSRLRKHIYGTLYERVVARWHIITGEYPPQVGGVSDYSRLIAEGLLAAGNRVDIWAPPGADGSHAAGLAVHRLPGHFGPRALAQLAPVLRAAPADPLLIQYVPQAYGLRGMNLPFCLWLSSLRRASVTVMFHEVMFTHRRHRPLKHYLLGKVTRVMARLASRAATRIMVASSQWGRLLRELGVSAPILWVPVPSTVAVVDNPTMTDALRRHYTPQCGILLGQFASHSNYSAERLRQILPPLFAAHSFLSVLLIGAQSRELRQRLLAAHPALAARLHATGTLEAARLSCALAACDLMVQLYPDGVSTRRSSVMAALAHGRAVATTRGAATEPLWQESRAVAMAPVDAADAMRILLARMVLSSAERRGYEQAALDLYVRRFTLDHTIAALMAA